MNRQRREGLFRIVIGGNGEPESVAVACAPEGEAVAYIKGFNSISRMTGLIARGLEVESPRLKRHSAREIK